MPPQAPLSRLSAEQLWLHYGEQLIATGFNIAAAIAILLVGFWFAGLASRGIKRWARRSPRFDLTLGSILASVARYTIMAIVVVAVLQRFGIQTASIVAVLGAATLAIGLALQGTLSNLAAGVMLVIFRPYRIGDAVELAGRQGVVREMSLFTTELTRGDNVKIVLPNGQCWGAPMVNFTAHPERRVEVTFRIAYGEDIDRAVEALRGVIAADARILAKPDAPEIMVAALVDNAVDLVARFWALTADYERVRAAALQAGKQALQKAGVRAPAPAAAAQA
ncbi:MAG: mechanosensitive ion channel family protein [Hyphomonadaceae bacterium]